MAFYDTPLFTEGVLPFLLVFVLIFAILQRTKVLGEGKTQIDAMISLAIALILIATPTPRQYIVDMVPWLAVAVVVLLIFLLVYGFVAEVDGKGMKIPNWVRSTAVVLAIIFVVVLVLLISGKWDTVYDWITDEAGIENILIIAGIGALLWMVLRNPESKTEYYSHNSGSGKKD